MGSAIEQHQLRIMLNMREDINSNMLTLTQKFLANPEMFETILAEILVNIIIHFIFFFSISVLFYYMKKHAAKSSINAQRGSFYLLNRETGELSTAVYDEALFESTNAIILKKLR